MAAVTVNSAKRGLRAELKQRLRALSAEERLRQSLLLTQKVREDCRELNSGKGGLASLRRRTSPGARARRPGSALRRQGRLSLVLELVRERAELPGRFGHSQSYFVIARKGIAAIRSCRDCRITLRFN